LLCILFSWSDDLGKGFDPGVFGRFDLAALAQPHLKFLFVCFVYFSAACTAYTDAVQHVSSPGGNVKLARELSW
jgi:hypothetical protein